MMNESSTLLRNVEILGALVRLREFRADDLDAAFSVVGDDRVTRSLSFDSRTRGQAHEMLSGAIKRAGDNPRTEYYLAIVAPPDDELIGFARLGLSGVRAAKLGVAVAASHWGRGYATDAAQAMVGFAFTGLGLHRVSAAIGPDNVASIATIRKVGFTFEGRLRDHVLTNGSWRDSLLYSILVSEWQGRSGPSGTGDPRE